MILYTLWDEVNGQKIKEATAGFAMPLAGLTQRRGPKGDEHSTKL